jgi:hypothetical protein
LEAGKKRLQGDTVQEATNSEVVDLKKENDQLKQLVAKLLIRGTILRLCVTLFAAWSAKTVLDISDASCPGISPYPGCVCISGREKEKLF